MDFVGSYDFWNGELKLHLTISQLSNAPAIIDQKY